MNRIKKKLKRRYFLIILFLILFFIFIFIQINQKRIFQKKINLKKSEEIKNNTIHEKENNFSFVIAGDNHNESKFYQKIVNYINTNQTKNKIAFFVDLGDSTRVGDYSEYLINKKIIDQLKVPHYMVLGDHDIVSNGTKIWEEFFGPNYYSWDYQNVHFVTIDNVTDINGLSEEQLIWLEKDLSKNYSKQQKIVFMHRPPEAPFSEPMDLGFKGTLSEMRIKKLIDILKKYKVNHIFTGHLHNFAEYSISGIPITITGGAGGPIYPLPFIGKNKHHFLIVEIKGDDLNYKIIEL